MVHKVSLPQVQANLREKEKQRREERLSLEAISGNWASYIQIVLLPVPTRCPVMTIL